MLIVYLHTCQLPVPHYFSKGHIGVSLVFPNRGGAMGGGGAKGGKSPPKDFKKGKN